MQHVNFRLSWLVAAIYTLKKPTLMYAIAVEHQKITYTDARNYYSNRFLCFPRKIIAMRGVTLESKPWINNIY